MMRDEILITRYSGGVQDSEGIITDPEEEIVYDDLGDVQDYPVVLERDIEGRPTTVAHAVVFLRNEEVLPLIKEGDSVLYIRHPFKTAGTAVVVGKRYLDGQIHLKWE